MKSNQDFLEVLSEDFSRSEEIKNIAFIKLSSQINKNPMNNLAKILQIIRKQNQNQLEKANLLYLIKLMTSQSYLDFKSQFVHTIFEALVQKAQDGDNQEFEIITLMLTNEDLQFKYLPFLTQCLGMNSNDSANFSMTLLERLLINVLEILQGKKKGPTVSQKSISNLIKLSFQLAQKRKLIFTQSIDHQNFLKICIHNLQLSRKYASVNQQNLTPYQNIWKQQLSKDLNCAQINALYGILLQLINFNTKNLIQQLQQQNIFNLIIQSSFRFILKCENINKFWHSYISQRQISNLNLINFRSVDIVNIFVRHLSAPSTSIQQLVQKLNIVDNFVLLTKIMTQVQHLKQFHQIQKMINPEVPINQNVNYKLFSVSLQALYSPKFVLGKQEFILKYLFEQMQKITQKIMMYRQNKFQNCIECFDLLPYLKILIIKCQKILTTTDKLMQSLVLFLFMFLDNKKYSQCFEGFLNLVCKKFSTQIIAQSQKCKLKILYLQIDTIFKRCLQYIKDDLKLTEISCHLRVIQNLFKITNQWQHKQIFPKISQLIQIAEYRHVYYDENLILLLKKLVKSYTKQHFGKIPCFKKLYDLTIQNKRVLYLDVLFDFAQTHNCKQIFEVMNKNQGQIKFACYNSPILQQTLLRCISYNVMTQVIQRDINSSELVANQLLQIIQKHEFLPKIYSQIIQIISKQFKILHNYQKNINKPFKARIKFIPVLISMLQRINDTLEQNNSCTKNEKINLCSRIADQLISYSYVTIRNQDFNFNQIAQLVERIKKYLRMNKMKNYKQMQRTISILTISYLDMEKQLQSNSKMKSRFNENQLRKILNLFYNVKVKTRCEIELFNIAMTNIMFKGK